MINIFTKWKPVVKAPIFASVSDIMSAAFAVSSTGYGGSKYRVNKGEPADGLLYGALVDLPDFTYVNDKILIATTKRQKMRQLKRVRIAATVKRMLQEIDETKHNSREQT